MGVSFQQNGLLQARNYRRVYHTALLHDTCVLARRHSFSLAHQVCSSQTQMMALPDRETPPGMSAIVVVLVLHKEKLVMARLPYPGPSSVSGVMHQFPER